MIPSFDPVVHVLLGDEPRQRLRIARSAMAAALYCLCLIVQWAAVWCGLANADEAIWLTAFCLAGSFGFVIAIRSGVALRSSDAALTTPQIVFAIVSVAFGYHVNAPFRAAMLMIVALVLVHGAFILPPHRCLRLGFFAVAVFGVSMAFGTWRDPVRFDALIETFTFLFTAFVLPPLAFLCGELSALRASERTATRELQRLMEQLRTLATQDDLTGLPNRRHVQQWMPHELARLRRNDGSLSLAILDLDLFKRVNDTFGHAVGDEVLRLFVAEVRTVLREGDVLARWGGEEFLLVMPDTRLADAELVLQRAREQLRTSRAWTAHPQSRVTFSAGLTQLDPGETLEQAVLWADFALYEAKGQGRDRTVVTSAHGRAVPTMTWSALAPA